MEAVLKLAAPLLAELARGADDNAAGQRATQMLLCNTLSGIAALAGAASLVAALWLFVRPHWGPVAAPLACAAVLFVLGALFFAYGNVLRRRRSPPRSAALLDALRQVDATKFFGAHKSELLIGALVLGLVLGSERSKR